MTYNHNLSNNFIENGKKPYVKSTKFCFIILLHFHMKTLLSMINIYIKAQIGSNDRALCNFSKFGYLKKSNLYKGLLRLFRHLIATFRKIWKWLWGKDQGKWKLEEDIGFALGMHLKGIRRSSIVLLQGVLWKSLTLKNNEIRDQNEGSDPPPRGLTFAIKWHIFRSGRRRITGNDGNFGKNGLKWHIFRGAGAKNFEKFH